MLLFLLQNPSLVFKMAFAMLDKKLPQLGTLIKLLGIATVLRVLIKALHAIYKHLLRPSVDLAARYGRGSYAMITGGSDGIGKAFARELAARGFNLILVARNAEKLTAVENEIKARNPSTIVQKIAVDFVDCGTLQFFEKIYEEVRNLDISILINNVGLDYPEGFLDTDEQKLLNLVKVNCIPSVFLCRKIMPKMRMRSKRSLVLNISSASGTFAQPYTVGYCASKAFVDFFTRALALEFKGSRTDILSVRPFYVSTPMNGLKNGFDTITPESCVAGIFSKIGHDVATYGGINHSLQGSLMECATSLPYSIQHLFWKTIGKDMMLDDKRRIKEFEKKRV